MATNTESIERLERKFWQSMVDKDADLAATMIAEDCLITGPQGVMRIGPERYREMTRDGKWRLDRFELSDVEVVCAVEDAAVIAYTVHQTGAMGDEAMDLTCADSSAWVREDGAWKCTLHTETIMGKPH